jgi:hypothetical protein
VQRRPKHPATRMPTRLTVGGINDDNGPGRDDDEPDFEWWSFLRLLRVGSQKVAPRNTGTAYAHKVIERFSQNTLHIPRLLAEDPHLGTKRRYEGKPNRSSFRSASPRSIRVGSPSTSRIEKDSTRADVRIGVCWPGIHKIP